MIININGQKLIPGLYWQNLTDTAHPKKEIVRAGKEAGADIVCVPAVKNPIQAGYISKSELPNTTGLRSLAGGLAEANNGSWIGMFEIPGSDKYYYIAIHNDHILANSDIVADPDEIRPLFEQTLSSGGWQFAIAPPGNYYPGTTVRHLTLEEMSIRRAPKLRSLEYKFEDLPIRKMIYGLIIIGGLTGAWIAVTNWQEEKEREEQARRQLELEQAKKKKEQITPPWEQAVPVDSLLRECSNQWKTVKYSIVGWQIKGWDCNSTQAIASYDKEVIASAVQLMNAMPSISLARDGLKASYATPIKLAATGSNPAVRGMISKATLMDYANSHALKVDMQLVTPPASLPGRESEAPPPPPWTLEKVNIDGTYPPFELLGLTRVPGLVIKKIATTKNSSMWNWHMEGELYALK